MADLRSILERLLGPRAWGPGRTPSSSDGVHGGTASPRMTPPSDPDAIAALAALVAILRAYGDNAFDVEDRRADEIRRQLYEAVQRLPDIPPRARPGKGGRTAIEDIPAEFTGLRRAERGYVLRTVSDMREMVWRLIRGINESMADEEQSGGGIRQHLVRLEQASQSGSIEDLKREVGAAVQAITSTLEARRARERGKLARLGIQLRAMTQEVDALRRETMLDPLTGLANRKAFDENVERAGQLHTLTNEEACLLLVDIDLFKQINDRNGHPAGDAVLRGIASCFARTFLRRTDFVARYGGDEFGVVLADTTHADAQRLGERLRLAVDGLAFPEIDPVLKVTVSVGVAELRRGEPATDWVQRADRALYQAKQTGRDRLVVDG